VTEHDRFELPVMQAPCGAEAILKLDAADLAPGVRVLTVAGELDMLSTPMLAEQISQEFAGGPQHLILDLSEVSFLGSSGLQVLAQAQETARAATVSLRLVCCSHAVLRPIEVTGLAYSLDIRPTLADAVTNKA
jgi:anti-sigma B factor antagonist